VVERFRFLRQHRLETPADFDRVFANRRSAADAHMVVYVAPNELDYPRLGLVVGRKVGPAVIRNRWKRLIREAFRLNQHRLPMDVDLVVLPRGKQPPTLIQMQASLLKVSAAAVRNKPPKRKPRKPSDDSLKSK
jgi:ribonuclease P protein component